LCLSKVQQSSYKPTEINMVKEVDYSEFIEKEKAIAWVAPAAMVCGDFDAFVLSFLSHLALFCFLLAFLSHNCSCH
jgi:hypothetical protein